MLHVSTPPKSGIDPPLDRTTSFEATLVAFKRKYTSLWHTVTATAPTIGERWTRPQQRRTESVTHRFIDEAETDLRSLSDRHDRLAAVGRIRRRLRDYGRECLALPAEQCDVIFSDAYFDVTAEFARRTRDFDARLEIHDLFQALRNLWIMNLFQLFLERRISLEPAMLGYSLLYPYTDNRLDDPELSPVGKRQFCRRFERRLRGEACEPLGSHERSVFDLVAMIESQYRREDHPEVYLSLLAIHRAQLGSLRQQRGGLDDAEVLELSIEKGGASVLADGYLVAGDLSLDEADFFFGYGIVLQLIDDLQDVRTDLEVGHRTLFTRRARTGCLDRLAGRLVHFLDAVLDRSPRFADRRFDVLKDVVRRNCRQLVVQAAAQNPRLFSRAFVRHLETFSPVRFSYARKKRGEVLRRYGKLNRRLRRETRLGSLFEALGRFAD